MKKYKIAVLTALIIGSTVMISGEKNTFAKESPSVKLELNNINSNDYSNQISGTYKVTNNGSKAIDLSQVKIKYYYTKDSNVNQDFHCYYSAVYGGVYRGITSAVKGTFISMNNAIDSADTYLEISFNKDAGMLNTNETVEIQTCINKQDWSNYNQRNDYSFSNIKNIVVTVDNKVISGVAPTKENENVTKEDLKVELAESSVNRGEIFEIPIYLKGEIEQSIAGFSYKLKFDSSKFEVLSIEAGEVIPSVSENFASEIYQDTEGNTVASMLFIDSSINENETIKNNGVIAKVKVKAKENAVTGSSEVTFTGSNNAFINISGNEIQVPLNSGKVKIK